MHLLSSIAAFFRDGGMFMYPIALVLLAGAVVAIERWRFLAASARANRALWTKVAQPIEQGDFAGVARLSQASDTALGHVLAQGLAQGTDSPADVERGLDEGLMEMTPLLEKRVHYLATFANVATLLGLLGTIIGLIKGFSAVTGIDPVDKADALSGAISVAMNTTAFGLIVAIPLLLLHTWLATRSNELIDSLEIAAAKLGRSLARHRPS